MDLPPSKGHFKGMGLLFPVMPLLHGGGVHLSASGF